MQNNCGIKSILFSQKNDENFSFAREGENYVAVNLEFKYL